MSKIRFGIIGCGWVGNLKHLDMYSKRPDTEILAISDLSADAMAAAKRRHGIPDAKEYTDYKQLLADPDIDAVCIATPHPLHAQMTIDALNAGKHVICEKPMATAVADAEAMIEASKRNGRVLTVGYQWRFRPETLYMKQYVESGALGEIYYAKAHATRRRSVPAWGFYTDIEQSGGGVLLDGAPHAIDLTLWLMDNYDVASVRGNVYRKLWDQPEGNVWGEWDPERFTADDAAFALITMRNGATIYLESSWALNVADPEDQATTLCGTKAGIDMHGAFGSGHTPNTGVRINEVKGGKLSILEPDTRILPLPGVAQAPSPFQYEADHFLDAIRTGSDPAVLPEQALVVTRIVEAVYRSSETGKTVYFDESGKMTD